MPRDVRLPGSLRHLAPALAVPDAERTSRSTRFLDGVGRLRAGVTIEQADAELTGITTSLAERYPDTNRNIAPFVTRFGIAAQFVAVMFALLGAVGFVLLIACANVANLLLARSADRARDVTLRLALGASRWRIVRQLLVEGLLLATAGGICGFALALPGLQMLRNLPAESAPPSWVQFTMDTRVAVYVVALCLGSALVCSLLPAWQASRPGLVATLNDAARSGTGGRSRRRWMGTLRGRSGRPGSRAPYRSRSDDAQPARPPAHRRRCRNWQSHTDGIRSSTTGVQTRRSDCAFWVSSRNGLRRARESMPRWSAMPLSRVPRCEGFASKARPPPSLATFRRCL